MGRPTPDKSFDQRFGPAFDAFGAALPGAQYGAGVGARWGPAGAIAGGLAGGIIGFILQNALNDLMKNFNAGDGNKKPGQNYRTTNTTAGVLVLWCLAGSSRAWSLSAPNGGPGNPFTLSPGEYADVITSGEPNWFATVSIYNAQGAQLAYSGLNRQGTPIYDWKWVPPGDPPKPTAASPLALPDDLLGQLPGLPQDLNLGGLPDSNLSKQPNGNTRMSRPSNLGPYGYIETLPGTGTTLGTDINPDIDVYPEQPRTRVISGGYRPPPPSSCPSPCPPSGGGAEVDLSEVIRLLNECLNRLGFYPVGSDCFTSNSVAEGIENISIGLRKAIADIGFSSNGCTQNNQYVGRESNIFTLLGAITDIAARIGFSDPAQKLRVQGNNKPAGSVEQTLVVTQEKLGFVEKYLPLDKKGKPDPTKDPIPVSGALDEIRQLPAEPVVFIQGWEGPAKRIAMVRISYNSDPKKGYRQHAQMSVPEPKENLTEETILGACKPWQRGDWLCSIRFENGREIQGWFQTKELGQGYLNRMAGLSTLKLAKPDGEFAATYKPGSAPTGYKGKLLYPAVAKVSTTATDEDGNPKAPLSMRLR